MVLSKNNGLPTLNQRLFSVSRWLGVALVIRHFRSLVFVCIEYPEKIDIWEDILYVSVGAQPRKRSININPCHAKFIYLNFQPIEVVSRYRDPQPQVVENCPYVINLRANI